MITCRWWEHYVLSASERGARGVAAGAGAAAGAAGRLPGGSRAQARGRLSIGDVPVSQKSDALAALE